MLMMLASPRAPVEPRAAPGSEWRQPHHHRPQGRRAARRVRRVALLAAVLCLIPVFVSYLHTLTQTSNSPMNIRTVEWLRDHGARGLVNKVESIYYSLTAPPTGGPALRALPGQAAVTAAPPAPRRRAVFHYSPRRIRPLIHPSLPGEGVWHATRAAGGTRPSVFVTSFRSDPAYPRLVAGVAWIDHTQTSTWLYPGRLEPSVKLARGPMEVPPRLRPRLVATFNSGFKLGDSGGGFAVGGHAYAPLKPGLATFLRHRDGRIDIRAWTGGPGVGPDIIFARQNLPLILDQGRPNPNLSDGPVWGATLGNAVRVWRSAIGIDHHGNLIYAAANNQTVGSLAAIMIHAGAVRAMELDINSYWTSFITYRLPGAGDPRNLLGSMNRSPKRYLSPDDRDFFAVYLR
jgi:Phosphodiester glycosidase